MTAHDVLVGFRLRLFTLAEELGTGFHRLPGDGGSPLDPLPARAQVDRWGLEALTIRERRRPRMPNQIGPHLEQRIVALALANPASGPGGSRPGWPGRIGARSGSRNTVSGACCAGRGQHPLKAAGAGRPPPRSLRARAAAAEPERHIDASLPGEKVQRDCFYVGRQGPSDEPEPSPQLGIRTPVPPGMRGRSPPSPRGRAPRGRLRTRPP